jgi:probable phosphoglycerate mutase
MSAIKHFIGDGGLSPLGVVQAERLRDRLAATREIQADVLIASTLPRARQTATILAPALGLTIIWDDDIQEFRPGKAEGMTIEDYKKTYDVDPMLHPYQPIANEGESWATFILRVGGALDRIVKTHDGKTIVLVCHGGIIDCSFLYFFRMSAWTPPFAGFGTRNTSITHWKQLPSFPDEAQRWHLMKYNDAFHLQDIGSEERIPWNSLLATPASDVDRPSVPLSTEPGSENEGEENEYRAGR